MDISNQHILGMSVEKALTQLRAAGETCLILESPDLDGGDPVIVIIARKESVGPARVLTKQMERPADRFAHHREFQQIERQHISLPFADYATSPLPIRPVTFADDTKLVPFDLDRALGHMARRALPEVVDLLGAAADSRTGPTRELVESSLRDLGVVS